MSDKQGAIGCGCIGVWSGKMSTPDYDGHETAVAAGYAGSDGGSLVYSAGKSQEAEGTDHGNGAHLRAIVPDSIEKRKALGRTAQGRATCIALRGGIVDLEPVPVGILQVDLPYSVGPLHQRQSAVPAT